MITPTLPEFIELAREGNLIPVYEEVVADAETPVSAYLKIAEEGGISFLLESAESAEKFGRYSFIGCNPGLLFEMRGRTVRITENGAVRAYETESDPLRELQAMMSVYRVVKRPGLPIFTGGAVGYLSYESVRYFEPGVPRARKDDLQVPDAFFAVTDTLLIFDHAARTIKILANAHVTDSAGSAHGEAVRKIRDLRRKLMKSARSAIVPLDEPSAPGPEPGVNMTCGEYCRMTADMQEFIKAGDIFQVVPSQRFEVPFDGRPIDLYRALRHINPSPYMFCLNLPQFAVVGASPEVHVRCEEGAVAIRPIAGTRRRGQTPGEDAALEKELLSDPKERAEHVMLVDLARNDIGRVCDFHSVRVTDFMTVERYSHVMHIVSHVTGTLRKGTDAYDVMRATFPAGTVTGAPKIRAMQIIAQEEPTCRGTYAGVVGYFGFGGNLDSCIAIRTVLLKDGRAHVQAGGGLVADSTPMGEYEESRNKARAALRALELARTFESQPSATAGETDRDEPCKRS
ncbi:MAG: anthranilate synthase component I [Verrucomicrobiae bacterium]|nr:anthranilate synthase component I [Verrucomicrobiae bacterium]